MLKQRDKDLLCDILWFFKGLKYADKDMMELPFNSTHLNALEKCIIEVGKELYKKKEIKNND